MQDILLGFIIIAIVGTASFTIYRKRKNGAHCMGCSETKEFVCHCEDSVNKI